MKSIGPGYQAGTVAVIETMNAGELARYCSCPTISLLLDTIANSGRPMEFNQIRYFVVLARELHFTRAAEACHVSQPALTKAIQKLEEEFGGALFLRERCHTQLTELGRTMLAGELDIALLVEGPDLHERLHHWQMFAEHYVQRSLR